MMKTIMLACAAGMSTSLLVTKMEEAAKENNLEVKIFAKPVSELDQVLKSESIDVLLLGPQVSFMKKELSKKLEPSGIPVATIDMSSYGMMDGEKVLNQALNS
ncbi:MAG: PTS sugar transporter subunit IIB [Trichococcus sp.]